jgi:hypothetical protein
MDLMPIVAMSYAHLLHTASCMHTSSHRIVMTVSELRRSAFCTL